MMSPMRTQCTQTQSIQQIGHVTTALTRFVLGVVACENNSSERLRGDSNDDDTGQIVGQAPQIHSNGVSFDGRVVQ